MVKTSMDLEQQWMSNNIFRFATKELSQDAFFAWLINGWNAQANQTTEENRQARHVAYAFLKLLYGGSGLPAASEIDKTIEIKQQYQKIDVLVIFKRKGELDNPWYALIIEDKTTSGEHDNQIARYRAALSNKAMDDHGQHTDIAILPNHIHVAYVKVDYWNDFDKSLVGLHSFGADDCHVTQQNEITPVNAGSLKTFLERKDLHIDSYMAKSYLEHLDIDYLIPNMAARDAGCHLKLKKGEFSSSAEEYSLLNRLFPKRRYKITQGTSFGRPWNNVDIWQAPKEIPFSDENYGNLTAVITRHLFWRVDTNFEKNKDSNSDEKYVPMKYLSLRQYENAKDIHMREVDIANLDKSVKKKPKLPGMPADEADLKLKVFTYMQNALNVARKKESEWFANESAIEKQHIADRTKTIYNQLMADSYPFKEVPADVPAIAQNLAQQAISGRSANGKNHESTLVHIQLNEFEHRHTDEALEKLYAGVYYITALAQALAKDKWTPSN